MNNSILLHGKPMAVSRLREFIRGSLISVMVMEHINICFGRGTDGVMEKKL